MIIVCVAPNFNHTFIIITNRMTLNTVDLCVVNISYSSCALGCSKRNRSTCTYIHNKPNLYIHKPIVEANVPYCINLYNCLYVLVLQKSCKSILFLI